MPKLSIQSVERNKAMLLKKDSPTTDNNKEIMHFIACLKWGLKSHVSIGRLDPSLGISF